MKIGMVGLGKLGLPVALAIESCGHEVCGTDIDMRVKGYLESYAIPYQEKDIYPLLFNHKIKWCDSISQVVAQSDITFIAVQTPHGPEYEGVTPIPAEREDFNYSWLVDSVRVAAATCFEMRERKTIAVISTCLPGTFREHIYPLLNAYVDYVYTPQFIAMGTVLDDYLNPEFNLIGVHSPRAAVLLEDFYSTINNAPALSTDITTAEGIKVSYNTWITAKTVIANAWGEMCERIGMNFQDMKTAWDLSDRRLVSSRYMEAGMSDGGGCHPRDNIALSHIARKVGMSHDIWEDLMVARQDYEAWHAQVAATYARSRSLPLVILGKAFKRETNIETGSPALLMAHYLRQWGMQFVHADDISAPGTPEWKPAKAVYFIATQHERYMDYEFPSGSTVLDPFGYIPDHPGVEVVWLGRHT